MDKTWHNSDSDAVIRRSGRSGAARRSLFCVVQLLSTSYSVVVEVIEKSCRSGCKHRSASMCTPALVALHGGGWLGPQAARAPVVPRPSHREDLPAHRGAYKCYQLSVTTTRTPDVCPMLSRVLLAHEVKKW